MDLRQLVDAITADEPFNDKIFEHILSITDPVLRASAIEDVRKKCRELKRIREFDNLLKAWQTKKAQELRRSGGNKTQFTDQELILNCGEWIANDAGVYKIDISGKGEPIKITACPHPILPVERMVNLDTETEKLKLAFFKDEEWKHMTVDCTVCYNKQQITVLGDRGVMVTSETSKDLVRYLSETVSLNMKESDDGDAIPLYRSIGRLGWVGEDFAPYTADIKYDGDEDFESIYKQVRAMGDREKWYSMANDVRKNLIVRLLIATSLASPLIEKVGALPFVLHLWGTTSFGKTVSLMVAMSVWGNPESGCLTRSMNMTQNAMARTASFLYNIPFGADELQQIRSRWDNFDNLIMYITEGIDRGRAKAKGGVEELKTWRNCFIFTGEEPVTKDNSGGGTKNRVIEVEVTKPLYADGNMVANTVREHYGWAGREFIDYVKTIKVDDLRDRFREIFNSIMKQCDTTDKQAFSMALILLADELSCQSIFKGDKPIEIGQVARFMHSNKTVDVAERAYTWALNWVSRNSNKFIASSTDVYGKLDADAVFVNRDILLKAMAESGFEFNAVSRKWAENGYIEKNTQGKFTHQTTINGIRTNCIKIVFHDAEEELSGIVINEEPPEAFTQGSLY